MQITTTNCRLHVAEIIGDTIVEAFRCLCTALFYVTFGPVIALAWIAHWLEAEEDSNFYKGAGI